MMSLEQNQVRYQRLGYRAFWMFFFQKAKPMGIVAVGMVALMVAFQAIELSDRQRELLSQALAYLLLIFFILLLGALVVAFLQYLAFEFALDEHALKIRSGILNIQIEAIPYRQMQNVDIERDLVYRVLGLSRMVILTAGTEGSAGDESQGIIPAIDKHVAVKLQEELISRANVEKVVDVHQNPAQ